MVGLDELFFIEGNMSILGRFRETVIKAGRVLKGVQFERGPKADMVSQTILVEQLHVAFPQFPLLFEEEDLSWRERMIKRVPGIQLLDGSDSNTTLPEEFIVADPLDGSVLFENGCPEWAISVAYIREGKPWYACVYQPRQGILITAERGAGCYLGRKQLTASFAKSEQLRDVLIGLDMCASVDEAQMSQIWDPLVRACRYPRNLPSVASGIELALGRTVAWCSTNARIWDVAGTALAVQEAGGIAECLDGRPIPWNCVRMPPLLFAANQVVCGEVRKILGRNTCLPVQKG